MKAILGKKIGMTQIFDEEGRIIPVTVIEAGPCWIVQVRSKEKNGYEAVQLGFQEIKKEKMYPNPCLEFLKKQEFLHVGF